MYQPEMYAVALGFMLISMLCWGSWANTLKFCRGYRFQLFYWDYVIGLVAGALVWGLTLGSHGSAGRPFLADLAAMTPRDAALSFASGAVFNVANLLLVAAIDIAGLAVAFPVGIGLALIVGSVGNYLIDPKGNPLFLFGGIALVLGAVVLDAMAYRVREEQKTAASQRGIVLSLLAGVLMGCFYPLISKAMTGPSAISPYTAMILFALGVAACAIPLNFLLMRRPLDGRESIGMSPYMQAPVAFHFWGVVGGMIWCAGAILNFVASQAHIVGPAVSYSIGQGATMVSACWGIFIWHEFAQAPSRARVLLAWMFVLFLGGLTSVAIAPLF
jgi:glucose uptake protein